MRCSRIKAWMLAVVVVLAVQPSSAAELDVCMNFWRARVGDIKEVRPSRIPTMREIQLTDGNVFYIEKGCRRIFVGEFIDADNSRGIAQLRFINRSLLDYSKFWAVSRPNRETSWIYIVSEVDYQGFRAALKIPRKGGSGFYFVLNPSSEKRTSCSLSKEQNLPDRAEDLHCEHPVATDLAYFGRGSMAIDKKGQMIEVENWVEFLGK